MHVETSSPDIRKLLRLLLPVVFSLILDTDMATVRKGKFRNIQCLIWAGEMKRQKMEIDEYSFMPGFLLDVDHMSTGRQIQISTSPMLFRLKVQSDVLLAG